MNETNSDRKQSRAQWVLETITVSSEQRGGAERSSKRASIGLRLAVLVLFSLLLGLFPSYGASDEDWPLACLGGNVTDAQGIPIAGAKVEISGTDGLGVGYKALWETERTDKLGRYLLGYARRSRGRVLIMGIRAEAPGFVRLDKQFITAKPRMAAQQPKDGDLMEFVLPDGTVQFTTLFSNNQLTVVSGRVPSQAPILSPNHTNKLDLVLTPGELLSGKVVMPDVFPYRDTDVKPNKRVSIISVKGSEFEVVTPPEGYKPPKN